MIRQTGTLKERHEDVPICQIDYNVIETMFQQWRQRPFKKGAKQPVSEELYRDVETIL